jgi:hypothetical protein
MSKKHIGSSFESFLKEDGVLEKTTSEAKKRVAITLRDKMKGLSPERRKKIEARTAELIAEERLRRR